MIVWPKRVLKYVIVNELNHLRFLYNVEEF